MIEVSDLKRRDVILLHKEVNADAQHGHVLAQSEDEPDTCLQNGDKSQVPKVRRAPIPWTDANCLPHRKGEREERRMGPL